MVASPCIGVCTDEGGVCIGCYRTLDEIAEWALMTPDQQRRVLADIETRRGPGDRPG